MQDTTSYRVLVTGVGGPAGIAVLESLRTDSSIELLAADMDPWAAGLYQVGASKRVIVPPGDRDDFVGAVLALCAEHQVDLVIPTVDCELVPLSQARGQLTEIGTKLLIAATDALTISLDKLALAQRLAGRVRVPWTALVESVNAAELVYPVIVKPRQGSGSRGVELLESPADLAAYQHAHCDVFGEVLVQEYLPGQEYSVDVLADQSGSVVACVPRVRVRVDSGVSVAGYTLVDPELESFAATVVHTLGLGLISNVQIRRDVAGRPALLEVNPRVPGSLALSTAAGVDMVAEAVGALRGGSWPSWVPHREVAMVRHLANQVVELEELVEAVVSNQLMGVGA